MLIRNPLSLLSLCLLLTACGGDSTTSSIENTVPVTPPVTPTEPQYSGARLELITPIEFKRTPIRGTYHDQLESRFSRDVTLSVLLKDQTNQVVFEHTSDTASAEHTLNLVDAHLQPVLNYAPYRYEITATLKDGSYSKTFKGNFTRQAKPLMEVEHRISDISFYGDAVLVAEDTDFGVPPNVHFWSEEETYEIPLTAAPDVIHDMIAYNGYLYFAGQRTMSGELLVRHDPTGNLADEAMTALFPCSPANQDDWQQQCNAVFALASYDNALWIGTDQGLYRLDADNNLTHIENHGLSATSDIKNLYVDHDQQLWALSFVNGGIAMLGSSGWQHFTQENSLLPAGGYLSVVQGKNREYWFAGNITGLVRMDLNSAELEVFTPANSNIIDHNLVAVAYTDEILVGSHDYGVAKRRTDQNWQISDNQSSEIKTIPTDACQWDPDSQNCKNVIVVERMIQTTDAAPRVFSAIGKGLYQLY